MRTLPSTRLRAIILPFMILALVACGGPGAVAERTAAPPNASPSVPVVVSPQPGEPSSVPDPSSVPSPVATPEPTGGPIAQPDPTPAPKPATWSSAKVLFTGECGSPNATLDSSGRFHVVATCGMSVRYATSADGRTWQTRVFSHPSRRLDTEPQITVDGSTLYVAFTRLRMTDGGCGDDGLVDVGVYYRTRHLPSGAWSAPVRIGRVADHLQSFRVVDGVMHGTFVADDGSGPISYGRLAAGVFRSVPLPSATATSLRVGDDGRARIAYSTQRSIRYATVRADLSLSTRTIFSSKDMQVSWPSLVLGAGNRAYVTFAAHQEWGGGCAEAEHPLSAPGTYFATDASGSWQVARLTKIVGQPSLVVDATSGQVSLALDGGRGIREYTRTPAGVWSGATIRGTGSMEAGVIRRDPSAGTLLLVASRWSEDTGGSEIVVLLKR